MHTVSTALRVQDIYLSPEDYLVAERFSETKHEYLNGIIYAMAGASRAHNQIARNILSALTVQLDGKTCEPFGSDMKLRIRTSTKAFYYYPDVVVDCSGKNVEEIEEPSVVFEVLSPETERADRGEKMLNYQAIPSTKTYVLVDQYRAAITVYRRSGLDEWTTEFLGHVSNTLDLPEIGCSIPLTSIYSRVLPAE